MLKRIEWIDIAKGMGIIYVVLSHVYSIPAALSNYIYSFHMPLFFFLSGYLFFENKYKSVAEFLKKRVQTLVIPYFIFSFITCAYWALMQNRFGDDTGQHDIGHAIIGIFYSNGIHHFMEFNVALWFLTCLFIVEIFFYFIRRFSKKDGQLILIIIILLS